MDSHEVAELPLPALGLVDGSWVASRRLLGLVGAATTEELLARVEVFGPSGDPARGERLPWSRLERGETFEESQRWRDPATGLELDLRVRVDEPGPGQRVLFLQQEVPRPRLAALASAAGEIAALLMEADDARAAAGHVLHLLTRVLAADSAVLLQREEERFRLLASEGGLEALLEPLVLAEGSPGWAALEQRGFVQVEDLASAQGAWAGQLREGRVACAAAVPLPAPDGTLVGLVCLGRRFAKPWLREEREALSSLARACGAALGRAVWSDEDRKVHSGMREVSERALQRSGELPLRELLRLLVEQACGMTGARYGALGVLNRERTDLEDFIVVGVGPEMIGRVGHLPRGRGLLGAVIQERRTIRVSNIASDPRSYGFPAHHPQMKSFLGVPLRIGDEVFGNFYLTDKRGAPEFSEVDARLLESLGAQAALAVSYARQTGEQRRLLDAMLRHAPHPVLFFTSEDHVTFCNSAAEQQLGARRGMGRTFRLLQLDGKPLPRAEWPAVRALAGEVVANLEVRLAAPNGRSFPCFASASPVWSETGALLGAVAVYQDISPFKEIERLREEFSAVVAHDLRNPVQSMLMQIDLLLRRAKDDAVTVPVPALERMQRSGARLTRLISDLLDATRIDAQRLNLAREPLNPVAVTADLLRQIELTLGGHAVELEVRDQPPTIEADRLRLEQILTNLVENAAKYSADGAPILVTVALRDGGAVFSVRDRGPGIEPADLPRLFDRYYQTRRAREKRSGLGLGLFITKGLVEAHGGRLWVESVRGQGSTFSLWLPAASGSSGATAEPHAP